LSKTISSCLVADFRFFGFGIGAMNSARWRRWPMSPVMNVLPTLLAMTKDIIRKLANETEAGITTEAQVVYVLAGIRKIIERDKIGDQYAAPRFHCDWALHATRSN
jgi:hypothetical protein